MNFFGVLDNYQYFCAGVVRTYTFYNGSTLNGKSGTWVYTNQKHGGDYTHIIMLKNGSCRNELKLKE